MAEFVVTGTLAEQLESIAQRENRSVEDVLQAMVDTYTTAEHLSSDDEFEAMAGMFDDDITDLSTTVRETMKEYYQKKYGNSD